MRGCIGGVRIGRVGSSLGSVCIGGVGGVSVVVVWFRVSRQVGWFGFGDVWPGLRGFGVVVASLALWFDVVLASFLGGVCGDAGGDDALDADGAVPKELGGGLDVPFEGGADSSWLGGVAFLGG